MRVIIPSVFASECLPATIRDQRRRAVASLEICLAAVALSEPRYQLALRRALRGIHARWLRAVYLVLKGLVRRTRRAVLRAPDQRGHVS